MTTEEMKKYLNEYFEYIKTIFCTEFSKYMSVETKNNILNINNIIELNEELCFKVKNNKKISFNLDVKKFIEENDLDNEKNLKDLKKDGKEYIEYLKENKDNVYKIIEKKLAKEALLLFLNGTRNVLSIGTAQIILEKLNKKYKIQIEIYPECKEKNIAVFISKIIGEDIMLAGVINQDYKLIKTQYNMYIEDNKFESYDKLINRCNKIYLEYKNKLGKEYFCDSLYGYEHLDYGLKEKINEMEEEKTKINMSRLKRLTSIKTSLIDINNQKFLFTNIERMKIENSIIEINKIIEKIMKDGKDNILENISKYYEKILNIEEENMNYSFRVWKNTLSDIDNVDMNKYNFLIGSEENNNIIETIYISKEHVDNIRTIKRNYGFIYEPLEKGIIYISTENLICKEYKKENYIPNYNTIYLSDIAIEVDNQEVSKLITPSLILKNNLRKLSIENKVILDKDRTNKVGIYCFYDDELENSPNYNKALELKEIYNLNIIPIKRKKISMKKQEKKEVTIKYKEEKKDESLTEKFKNFKDKVLYEKNDLTDFKKTL